LDEKLDIFDSEFTVFVPSNSAFDFFLQEFDYDDIVDCPDVTLKNIIRQHIVKDHILYKKDLNDRCSDLLEMQNGESTRTVCENSGTKIYQKGAGNSVENTPRIISFNIEACNGVIHVVYRVILPSDFGSSSRRPTLSPTRDPTRHPNPEPTRHPTRKPTPNPVSNGGPTRTPTRKPFNPTRSPTRKPTSRPSRRSDDASCSAHPQCAAQDLVGDCCPTIHDERLDCCSDDTPTRRPTPNPTFHHHHHHGQGSCAAYPKCTDLGLEGICCPTNDGDKLNCCFDEQPPEGSCSAYPKCKELGLEGECCPTNDDVKLDCCYDTVPGTCSRYPGCAAKGLEGDCCPAANGRNLDCCDVEEGGLPIIHEGYCDYAPDFSCYKYGRPECCLKSSIACPKEEPRCEVGFPIVGNSYCTFSPNYGCYENGWPECCGYNANTCPEHPPDCEVGNPVVDHSYCRGPPNYQCYELGYPTCCFDEDSDDCYHEAPLCNVGERGCDQQDSLLSIYDFVCSQHNFAVLCYLVQKAGIDKLLDETGTYTIFAPSNDAFEKLGEEVVNDLVSNNPRGELRDILNYHISDNIYFEKDLYCDRKIDTLRGDSSDDFTTTKCKSRGLFQKGNGNEDGAHPFILATDVVTCNGIVHVVDKVILPRE